MRKLLNFTQLYVHRRALRELLVKYKCQNLSQLPSRGAVTVRSSLRAGSPAVLFAKTCLCASLLPFPVVKAWSAMRPEDPKSKLAKTLRLKNPKDTALIAAIQKADEKYKLGTAADLREVTFILAEQAAQGKVEPELKWRLARITYESAKVALNAEEKANLIADAFKLVREALEMDDGNYAIHKWMAILLNEVSTLKGLKEQITQSVNVKVHIMKAIELNPWDATCRYMLGSWCFSVAEVPWYQKKVAATLFATPPESTFTEALEHFLEAERLDPHFYSSNHLMLAKTYIQLGNLPAAAKYLQYLEKLRGKTTDDFMAKTDGRALMQKYYKTQEGLDEAAARIDEVAQ